jgi:hypothetical protein
MTDASAWRGGPSQAVGAGRPANEADSEPIEVVLIHSNLKGTRCAMATVVELARDLHARIRLLVPEVVPLASHEIPPVAPRFLVSQLMPLTGAVQTLIDIRLGSDAWEIVQSVLPPHSLVVIGGSRWWPRREMRLAKRLQKQGHNVLFVPVK